MIWIRKRSSHSFSFKCSRNAVKKTVQSFLDNVIRELSEGNRLEFRDFGVFEIRERKPRIAQNPKTLERVPVPAKRTVKFKVGRLMKLALEGDIELTLDDDASLQFDVSMSDEHVSDAAPDNADGQPQ